MNDTIYIRYDGTTAPTEELTEAEKLVMEKYGDIINLPHHVSQNHPQMPAASRAAQFASFAALSGYEDAIDETAKTVNAED
ncbi:MAG: hypothetical protein LUD72_03545 [Bacteroidales bacterium]|nr:hypothetical protein [Bacteroidales bacterium]